MSKLEAKKINWKKTRGDVKWLALFAAIALLGFLPWLGFGTGTHIAPPAEALYGADRLRLPQQQQQLEQRDPMQLPGPASERYFLSTARQQMILYGDGQFGGHKAGYGKGAAEFPATWDATRIALVIATLANDPNVPLTYSDGHWLKIGQVQGVQIRVAVDRDSHEILTGYPVYGAADPAP